MPHVFTIDGAPSSNLGSSSACKTVQRKNGCTIKLCKTGRGKTGWEFIKGSGRCPTKRRNR